MKYLEKRKPTKEENLRFEFNKYVALIDLARQSELKGNDYKLVDRLHQKAILAFRRYKSILIQG